MTSILLMAIALAGCEPRFDVRPTYATQETYAEEIDQNALPAETRELYNALLAGRLGGAQAAEFQRLLDTAQRITETDQAIIYEFQMTRFDRPYEKAAEEGVPLLFVMVQKKFGHIYACDVTAPCF